MNERSEGEAEEGEAVGARSSLAVGVSRWIRMARRDGVSVPVRLLIGWRNDTLYPPTPPAPLLPIPFIPFTIGLARALAGIVDEVGPLLPNHVML